MDQNRVKYGSQFMLKLQSKCFTKNIDKYDRSMYRKCFLVWLFLFQHFNKSSWSNEFPLRWEMVKFEMVTQSNTKNLVNIQRTLDEFFKLTICFFVQSWIPFALVSRKNATDFRICLSIFVNRYVDQVGFFSKYFFSSLCKNSSQDCRAFFHHYERLIFIHSLFIIAQFVDKIAFEVMKQLFLKIWFKTYLEIIFTQ